jgi:beta-lactamase class A
LKLDQYIPISKEDVEPDYYSPIRDSFPDGTSMMLSKILEYTVCMSDNIGCDVLLRLIGGPKEVETYLRKNGIEDVRIVHNEQVMQSNWINQYDNWTTANCANKMLLKYYKNKKKLLSKKSYSFLWEMMKATSTGPMRLKGELPESTIVAHKTGTSGKNDSGMIAAVNDIGIVFLPNGDYYFISVFVSNSMHSYEENEKIIADISKAAYSYFVRM